MQSPPQLLFINISLAVGVGNKVIISQKVRRHRPLIRRRREVDGDEGAVEHAGAACALADDVDVVDIELDGVGDGGVERRLVLSANAPRHSEPNAITNGEVDGGLSVGRADEERVGLLDADSFAFSNLFEVRHVVEERSDEQGVVAARPGLVALRVLGCKAGADDAPRAGGAGSLLLEVFQS